MNWEPMLSKGCQSILLIAFGIAVFYTWSKLSKGRNTSANAWMVPFAYLSLSTWIAWALQYLALAINQFSSVPHDWFLNAALLLAMMQDVLWIIAILSLHTDQFSRLSVTLSVVVISFIGIALLIYETEILTYGPVTLTVDAVITGSMFTVLAITIWHLRPNKLFAVLLALHGLFLLCSRIRFIPLVKYQLTILPLWHLAVFISWRALIGDMLVTFRVMIASTIKDLRPEREAVDRAIRSLDLRGLRSEIIGSRPYNPKSLCKLWAEQCNVFILIIGQRYGHYVKSMGKSVVEFEFEVAQANDPGKIFVYVKEGVKRHPKLKEFLVRLQEFEAGYMDSTFHTPEELHTNVRRDVKRWLEGRDDWD